MMIKDIDTNIVYLADKLEKKYSDFYKRFTNLLNEMGIEWKVIPDTNDIWARDYMPLQMSDGRFIRYCYNPDYLQEKKYIKSKTAPALVCDAMGIECNTCTKDDKEIVIDGGNVTLCGDYIVMTDKVFTENGKEKNDPQFKKVLEEVLGQEIIIIPWHCIDPNDEEADVYGHSDGFLHWCGGNRVLMSNHRDFDPQEATEIRHILESYGFEVTEMLFNVDKPYKRNWAYINYLQVGSKIIMPSFGVAEDRQALAYVQEANPGCEIRQIRMADIAANGGALHCITWNIKE